MTGVAVLSGGRLDRFHPNGSDRGQRQRQRQGQRQEPATATDSRLTAENAEDAEIGPAARLPFVGVPS